VIEGREQEKNIQKYPHVGWGGGSIVDVNLCTFLPALCFVVNIVCISIIFFYYAEDSIDVEKLTTA
jgi:hypothetical protein